MLANGVPAQPQFDVSGNLTSLTNAAAPGRSVTYSFVAPEPGSYVYESGTSPAKQVPMGLFGALIVRPTLGADYADNRVDSQFTATESSWSCFRPSTRTSTRRPRTAGRSTSTTTIGATG